jgi:mitochondrial fission protein ELM1
MSAPPTVWVLLGKGTGGNGQMKSLAAALGWPYETKELAYNRLQRCPNLLLGASGVSLDRSRSSTLAPPWPDVVIGGSRRSAPIARWIKKQSRGATRLVHLMHTQAPLAAFDLVITTPQYRLPARDNVLHNTVPLNHIAPERLAAAATQWAPRFAALPRPWIAVLIGGSSSSYRLGETVAARLGREVSACARAQGGAILLTTSARTPPLAADALIAAIDAPSWCYRWRAGDADNPYAGFLALADQFVVTVDSASLAAEACASGRPVAVFRWPARTDKRRVTTALHARPALLRLYDRLVYLGLVKPTRDFDAYFDTLRARGLVRYWDEASPAKAPAAPLADMERAVARVRQLVGGRAGAP